MTKTHNKSAREQALHVLHRVETKGAYVGRLLAETRGAERDNDHGRDRALLEQLVKGTLDWRGRIDAVLDGVVKGGISSLTPWIRNILRLGTYQILFLDRIPPEVAVHESVELAKRYGHRGTIGLVNAVLRKVAAQAQAGTTPGPVPAGGQQDEAEGIAATYSHPLWMAQRWIEQLGAAETIELCRTNNQAWPLCLLTNTLKISTPDLRRALHAEGLECHPAPYHPDCTIVDTLPHDIRLNELSAYHDGLFLVQDESSAFVARVVDPQPGEFVVDLCSAPGGKAANMAMLMRDQGRILAVDLHPKRLGMVEANCERLGVSIVETVGADGRSVQLDRPADRVLVDAPCSGLGALGRRSDARWNKSEDDLPRLRALQLEILRHAATLPRVGGRLVYSTCTIDPEENEGIVREFLRDNTAYRAIEASDGLPCLPSALVDEHGYYHTWPHRHGMGGAFGAAMVRVA